MKKNKTLAFMLAAALLVGGTFLGTKALFTDKVDVASELSISTGDLDIEIVDCNPNWSLYRNGAEYSDGTSDDVLADGGNIDKPIPGDKGDNGPTEGTFVNNLKPGDLVCKNIYIENQGTLIADVTLAEAFGDKLGELEGLVNPDHLVIVDENGDHLYDENDSQHSGKFTLEPGQRALVSLNLFVDVNGDNKYNTDAIENTVINLNNAWTLNAEQQNPDPNN